MTGAELTAILKSIELNGRTSWEQSRYIAFITAASNGAKLNKPTDLVRFSWEQIELDKSKEDYSIEKQQQLLNVLNRI